MSATDFGLGKAVHHGEEEVALDDHDHDQSDPMAYVEIVDDTEELVGGDDDDDGEYDNLEGMDAFEIQGDVKAEPYFEHEESESEEDPAGLVIVNCKLKSCF
jgi:hypothetical protein